MFWHFKYLQQFKFIEHLPLFPHYCRVYNSDGISPHRVWKTGLSLVSTRHQSTYSGEWKGGRNVAGAAGVYAAAPLTHRRERSLWLSAVRPPSPQDASCPHIGWTHAPQMNHSREGVYKWLKCLLWRWKGGFSKQEVMLWACVWVGSHRSCVTRVEEGQDPRLGHRQEKNK